MLAVCHVTEIREASESIVAMWHSELRPTDINDPMTGEPLYVLAKIRPRWYWQIRRIKLFLSIVWRPYDTARLDWSTAWKVSEVSKGPIC